MSAKYGGGSRCIMLEQKSLEELKILNFIIYDSNSQESVYVTTTVIYRPSNYSLILLSFIWIVKCLVKGEKVLLNLIAVTF